MSHSPGFLQLVQEAKRRVTECTTAEVKAKIERGDTFHFIDVREDHEFAKDHAKGARHLGKGILERDIETIIPDKHAEIVLYCGGGYPRRRCLATDGLYKRELNGRGHQGLAGSRLPHGIAGSRSRVYLFVRSNSLIT